MTAADPPAPAPSETGVHDGLAWARFDPSGPALGGVLVLHGADSRKERQADFAAAAAAAGLVALTFDQRGHGRTGGAMDGAVVDELVAMVGLLRGRLAPGAPIALRGSSLGGYLALVGAAPAGAAAVVAVCPAAGHRLRRALHVDGRFAFARDREALDALLAAHDEREAVARTDVPLLLMHAAGDEVVPVEGTRALVELAPRATYLQTPGGHHGSVQHDPELLAFSVRFLVRELARAEGSPRS